MTYEEANRILRGMGILVRSYKLEKLYSPMTEIDISRDSAALSGSFTADQLEAIAMWMNNPVEVTNA